MKKEYQRVKGTQVNSDHTYFADGILLDFDLDVEVLLLETSNEFGNNDLHKHTRDHVKVGFGLISMLHVIADKYEYGSPNLFMQVKVYFIHAKNKKLRIWSLECPTKKLYVLNCLGYANVPDCFEDMELKSRSLGNLLWTLKLDMDKNKRIIENLKQSHNQRSKIVARKEDGYQLTESLTLYLQDNDILKLPSEEKLNGASYLGMLSNNSSQGN
jgi:hypothetical protein